MHSATSPRGLSGFYHNKKGNPDDESPYWVSNESLSRPKELEEALKQQVARYVADLGGKKPIRRILVANNGIAAVKAIRSTRKWSYETFGSEKAMQFLVMATPEDIAAAAEYIKLADEFVEVAGGANNQNYANVELIVDVAVRYECDAVFAGWGHASENPKLPAALAATNKIAFMGPGSIAMAALGDKIASTLIAQSVGVPTVPWSGKGIKVNFKGTGSVDQKAFDDSCVTSAEHAEQMAESMGYPIMVKASEGGGGKGIRVVQELSQMASAYRQVAGEVPGSPIFLMTMMSGARHLEVQLIADQYGEAIALSGRDCSVQRRCQKIIEEGPQVVASEQTWERMQAAAVALAKEVDYQSAGTVEYLYVPATDEFFFLELNPRLQVEHPCSEWITHTNLPALQVNIAMGIPMGRIPEIRQLYQLSPYEYSSAWKSTLPQRIDGHVIAARITAENPDEGFQPSSGSITELTFRNTPRVWGYFSTYNGVHEFADSQFGHLFAWGPNREAARRNMVCALKELSIRGDIRTTVEYLITLMETTAFRENEISTQWLDGLIANRVKSPGPDSFLSTICGALYKAHTRELTYLAEIRDVLEKGQIPPKHVNSFTKFSVELILNDVKYNYVVERRGETMFEVTANDSSVHAEMRVLKDDSLHICLDGRSHIVYAKQEPSMLRLTIDGKNVNFSNEYDPTKIESVMAGKLVRYLVPNGSHVSKGDDIAELEVMKMYISIQALECGIIEQTMVEGSSLDVGDILGKLTLDDPSMVKKAEVFTGPLPKMKPPVVYGNKVHQRFRAGHQRIQMILAGYQPFDTEPTAYFLPPPAATSTQTIQSCLLDPSLGLHEIAECLATISARIPNSLTDKLDALISKGCTADSGPYAEIADAVRASVAELDEESAKASLSVVLQPLNDIIDKHVNGTKALFVNCLVDLLRTYMETESLFQKLHKKSNEEVIYALRDACASDPKLVMEKMISHKNLAHKNNLVIELFRMLQQSEAGIMVSSVEDVLTELSIWPSLETSAISRMAREMLAKNTNMSTDLMITEMSQLLELVVSGPDADKADNLERLAANPLYVSPVLLRFVFSSSDARIQTAAIRSYVLRIYHGFDVSGWFVSEPSMAAPSCAGIRFTAQWQYALLTRTNSSVPTSPARSPSTASAIQTAPMHVGQIVVLESIAAMKTAFEQILVLFNQNATSIVGTSVGPMNTLNLFMRHEDDGKGEEALIADLSRTLASQKALIRKCALRSITVVLVCDDFSHNFYTFSSALDFEENKIARHIDPALAYQLGLERLSNFALQRVPTKSDPVHAFYAEHEADRRFFVRTLVRSSEFVNSHGSIELPGAAKAFTDSLAVLEDAMTESSQRFERMNMNHIFMNLLAEVNAADSHLEDFVSDCLLIFKRMLANNQGVMENLRVTDTEIKLSVKLRGQKVVPLVFTLSSPTAHHLLTHVYQESFDEALATTVLREVCKQPGQPVGVLNDQPADTLYKTLDTLQQRRLRAAVLGGNYAYDFCDIFSEALRGIWKREAESMRARGLKTGTSAVPDAVVKSVELMLDKSDKLIEVHRPPGENKVAMVAWRLTLLTPEYPNGRDIYVIANDITVSAGSFGPAEDRLFDAVSKLARAQGLPRIYIAANSGARIGLAEEIRSCYKTAWNDDAEPTKGFKYLYLTPEDKAKFDQSVNAEKVFEDGEERWKIVDIVGAQDGLGVECLAGSGLIAGETSLAYDEIFTLTYVVSRSVGIGAYLVRLGQRVIQKTSGAPIILTGMESLNKLLGRDVYQSNAQLGGPRVMYNNGVSHLCVDDDMQGVTEILRWLAFVPRSSKERLHFSTITDPIARTIDFVPGKTPYDTREMLAGCDAAGKWVSGFFDKDSWIETLAGWAKNVIVGRARLGGIPLGVIAVETRTVEKVLPADPADAATQEVVQPQAAQVWFPDSSFKTASAIGDFNREKLPLMIFANWRGFSGGTRDMFDEILKFGSYIVDELVGYKQPVLVYIPRHAELRGGAWVVVDPNINPNCMEMFADTQAAGGVLEAEGTVVVKYRKPHLLRTMHRIDAKLGLLDGELQQAIAKSGKNSPQVATLTAQIELREKDLLPIYKQLAIKFAELHDTPGRMKAKGVIDTVVPWEVAREFFYWRLRRRLEEMHLRNSLVQANPVLRSPGQQNRVGELLRSWFARWEVVSGPRSPRTDGEGAGTVADLQTLEKQKAAAAAAEDFDLAARLKRQIEAIKRQAAQTVAQLTKSQSQQFEQGWADDRRVIEWLDADEADLMRRVAGQRKQYISEKVFEFGKDDMAALVDGLQRLVDDGEADELTQLLSSTLRGPLLFGSETPLSAQKAQSGRMARFTHVD